MLQPYQLASSQKHQNKMILPFAKVCHFVKTLQLYPVTNNKKNPKNKPHLRLLFYMSLLEISTDKQEVAVHWFKLVQVFDSSDTLFTKKMTWFWTTLEALKQNTHENQTLLIQSLQNIPTLKLSYLGRALSEPIERITTMMSPKL